MMNLSCYILLSLITFMANCVKSPALKLTAHVSSSDSRIMWENIPQIRSTAFIGADKAWLVTDRDGELWRTEDGGKNWHKLSGKAISGMFRVVSFIDSQRGWAVNYEGKVWRTGDGGQSWVFISYPKGGKYNEPIFLPEQMLFVDESHGWIIDAFAIWQTKDGGTNWDCSLSISDTPALGSWQPLRIFFINPNIGWVSTTNGIVHSTKDGGKTWQSKEIGWGSKLEGVFFINQNTGWLGGTPSGELYHSENGGKSWWKQQQISIEKNYIGIEDVYFLNEKVGWAIGRTWMTNGTRRSQGGIFRTSNGGRTWQAVNIGENEPFFDRIYFVDSQYGWLFSRDNVYRTQDGGKTWNIALGFPPIKVNE
jgi:photosystem II stability/assembly factor-like uncharacterized protein